VVKKECRCRMGDEKQFASCFGGSEVGGAMRGHSWWAWLFGWWETEGEQQAVAGTRLEIAQLNQSG